MAVWPWDNNTRNTASSGGQSSAMRTPLQNTATNTYAGLDNATPAASGGGSDHRRYSGAPAGQIIDTSTPRPSLQNMVQPSSPSPGRTITWSNGYLENQQQVNRNQEFDFQKQQAAQQNQRRQSAANTILGYLQGGSPISGPVGSPVNINAGPIWSSDQVQQRVNADRAGIDAGVANQNATLQRNLAGRGFGANSPLYQALAAGSQMQGRAAGTAQTRDTRLQSSQANAQQVMQGQSLQESQRASLNREQIARDQANAARTNALLGAYAQLMG